MTRSVLQLPGRVSNGRIPSPFKWLATRSIALGTPLWAGLCAPLCVAFCLLPVAKAQQDITPQQAPAPIVRVRPRPQSPAPTNAPADAAPLVSRPPRPRPIRPSTLSGTSAAPTGLTDPSPHAPRTQTTPTPGATGQTSATPRTSPSAATSQATQPSAEHPASPKTAPLSTILNRNIIVLDPSHGAQDSGSRIGDNLLEKDVTLALAFRLRSLLTARGFTVVLTRDSDAATEQPTPNSAPSPLTLDSRAGIANRNRAAACLLLHATGRGTGVHLYTSELDPAPSEAALLPWLTAQAAWVPASQQLERSLSAALGRSHISLVASAASIRPVDSLTCPALVVELAPENNDPRSIAGAGYQERVAQALAGALVFWQNQVQPPPKPAAPLTPTHTPTRHRIPKPPVALTPAPQEPQP